MFKLSGKIKNFRNIVTFKAMPCIFSNKILLIRMVLEMPTLIKVLVLIIRPKKYYK